MAKRAAKAAKGGSSGGSAAKRKPAAKKSSSRKSSSSKRSAPKVTAQVTLRGRFRPGTRVRLYKSTRPEALRHAEGDELLAAKKVDDEGVVRFTSADGVEVGGRYFIFGHIAGRPESVRITGREPGDEAGIGQRPIEPDPVKHADGVVAADRGQPKADPVPAKVETDEGA